MVLLGLSVTGVPPLLSKSSSIPLRMKMFALGLYIYIYIYIYIRIYIHIYIVDNLDFVCLFLSGLQLTVFLESQITFPPSDLQLIAILMSQKDLRLGALSGNAWNF